ncbi:hypothetical protein J8273_0617 [Carpediemonas membranifera]|uniref:Uncharacterized protein n=1 Tax=Carpediemonas membranifera TaxID=201153 RepID=A0A8J6BCR7_9EUKA|nr:hypothetical protein J8273_0617 [Carpediemonas membranifera]|eukprot:KAG9397487.1 hypothetical protein J8273_0617 [Carpediemonas membranifera]
MYYTPAISAGTNEAGPQTCIGLSDAAFGALTAISITYDDLYLTELALSNGKICFTLPVSTNDASVDHHTVVASLDGHPFLVSKLASEVTHTNSASPTNSLPLPTVIAIALGSAGLLCLLIAIVCFVSGASTSALASLILKLTRKKSYAHAYPTPIAGQCGPDSYGMFEGQQVYPVVSAQSIASEGDSEQFCPTQAPHIRPPLPP